MAIVRKKTYPRRKKTVRKYSRSKSVASKRFATRVKKVVMKVAETKFTKFVQMHNTEAGVPNGDNILSKPVSLSAAIYPAVGDDRYSCDGFQYYLKGLNVSFSVLHLRQFVHLPLTVMVAKVHNSYVITNGNVTTRTLWPQTLPVSGLTSIPVLVGPMEKSFGTIVKRMTIRPYTRVVPQSGKWESAGDSADDGLSQVEVMYNIYIPINKRITRDAETAAEIPAQIKRYALYFHVPQIGGIPGGTGYSVRYIYTQAVFKDV